MRTMQMRFRETVRYLVAEGELVLVDREADAERDPGGGLAKLLDSFHGSC